MNLCETSEAFKSAKAHRPIPVQGAVFRDALVRASLDPAVRSIDCIPHQAQIVNVAIIVRDEGRFVYGVEGDAAATSVDFLPQCRLLTRRELYGEPAFSNDRLIWAYRTRRVSNGLRFQILRALATEGPMSLSDLISTVRITRRSAAAPLALACADLVEVDDLARKPVGGESTIRCRSLPVVKHGDATSD